MAQIESIIQPDRVLNDFRRESIAFVWIVSNFHPYIIAQLKLIWQYPWRCSVQRLISMRRIDKSLQPVATFHQHILGLYQREAYMADGTFAERTTR